MAPIKKCLIVLAAAVLVASCAHDPNKFAVTRANKGAKAMQKGRYRRAVQYLDQAVAAVPDYAEAWVAKGMAHAEMEQMGLARESYLEAEAIYRALLQSDLNNVDLIVSEAYVLVLLGRRLDAAWVIDQGLERLPTNTRLIIFSKGLGDPLDPLSGFDGDPLANSARRD